MPTQHTIIVILEAKPGQEDALKTALEMVAKHSRQEEANIDYRLHQSLDNPAQFILYENWVSEEKHQMQFEKPYIQAFAQSLDSILANPFEAYRAEEII